MNLWSDLKIESGVLVYGITLMSCYAGQLFYNLCIIYDARGYWYFMIIKSEGTQG